MTMKAMLLICLVAFVPAAAQACGEVALGELTVTDAWSRATIGAGRPGIFYVEIRNAGARDDALLGLSTPAASMPMLHETVVKDGLATMPHAAAVPIPAGGVVQLAPGGFHGMLMGLTAPLTEGGSFPVTLTFREAGEVTVETQVQSIRSMAAECVGGR